VSLPAPAPAPVDATAHAPFPIHGTDYLELHCGNARQACHYYQSAFGFRWTAYSGPETGERERARYLLEQGKVRLVLTSGLKPGSPVVRHQARHGDGVRALALWVEDCRAAFAHATAHGAVAEREPEVPRFHDGEVVIAAIRTYGDAIHSLVERHGYAGRFLPGFVAVTPRYQPAPVGLEHLDHCVCNVELGRMDEWVGFYERTMGFRNLVSFDDRDISTEYSALMSKVMANGNGRIKFPINEPAPGRRKSQVDEYLEFHDGPGVQHVTMATHDIVATVTALRERGVEFLTVPDAYYDDVLQRTGRIDEDLAQLHQLGILVDRDDEGYLLQIFTRLVEDRPTLFFEIIQRKGARSFGAGNFKALFEAIEREQARRGNL
jgi:4-hydroxyphenylpyruvate dioxygenase